MERTNKKTDDGLITYKKKGGGSLWFQGKRIMENQTFQAHPDDIPNGFKDAIVRIDGQEHNVKPVDSVNAAKPSYFLAQRGKTSWYNVEDSNGNIINDDALRRVAALDLIKELEEG